MAAGPVARRLPRDVWALGLVSLCMDVSSEMVLSVLPLFLVTVLGAGTVTLGIIEGAAEAAAAFTRLGSGALSDYLGRRKRLALAGYGLAAATKPLFALAHSAGAVFAARFLDRIGKGVRDAPRDALLADVTPDDVRGAAYGLRQGLDTLGAVAGPLVAAGLLALTGARFRVVFWTAAVPGVLSVAILALGVREPAPRRDGTSRARLAWADVAALDRAFGAVVLIGVLLMLARFSEAFVLLRAGSVGVAVGNVPFVMAVMNLASSAVSYPVGRRSDAIGRRPLLAAGLVVLGLAHVVLAAAASPLGVAAGAVLWGVHVGATAGLLSALVADTVPAAVRGTAFGIFNVATGAAVLVASVGAGWLWAALGPRATFVAGASAALVALLALLVLGIRRAPPVMAGSAPPAVRP